MVTSLIQKKRVRMYWYTISRIKINLSRMEKFGDAWQLCFL